MKESQIIKFLLISLSIIVLLESFLYFMFEPQSQFWIVIELIKIPMGLFGLVWGASFE